MRSVLYNAAKLLREDDAAGFLAAIYVKLYQAADEPDGNSVWAAFTAWTGSEAHTAALSIDDCVALTTYSNDDEDTAGRVNGSPRNYLINARTRNARIAQLIETRQSDSQLVSIITVLELQRLLFLRRFIGTIHEFLRGQNDFERMNWVTFLYDYLYPAAEGAPFWQKPQRIENEQNKLTNEIFQLSQRLQESGSIDLRGSSDLVKERFSFLVQPFLVVNRIRGRAIMDELAERLSPFSLENILQAVETHLAIKEQPIDFGAILGLWTESESDEAAPDRDMEAFLKRDPALLIRPLELRRLGVHLDPILQGIDAFLDRHSALVEQVRLDLERGLKKPGTGRNGMTHSQALRSLTLMRVKNWDYRELRERINEGYTLRGFTPV